MKKIFSLALCALLVYINIFPARAAAAPTVINESAVLIDADSGRVLYQKNMHQKMYPASTTKILTGLLAVEKGNLSDTLTFSHDAVFSIERGSSHASISEGEQMSLEQALYAMSVESANDAAKGVGEYLAAKEGKSFSRMMNERAAQAGAMNSNFVNAHGLHDDNHYTTAYDLAMIAKDCIKYEEFNKIFSTETFSIPPTNKQPETRTFHSANWFLNGAFEYDTIVMSKTGWTGEASHTMVTCAKRGDVTLICVVMKSTAKKDKWNDSAALFDWGFENFKKVDISGEYVALCAPQTINCDDSGRLFIQKEDIVCPGTSVLLSNGDSPESIKADFSAPVLSSDLKTAKMTVELYTGRGDGKNVLATVSATAPVSERKTVSALHTAPKASGTAGDVVMLLLFGVLSFVAAMICDILIARRI